MANDAGVSNGMKAVCTVLLLLMLGGWAVALGGLGSLTHLCNEDDEDWVAATAPVRGPSAFDSAIYDFETQTSNNQSYDCGMQLSLFWWIIALQFFVLCMCIAGLFFATFHARSAISFLLAIVTTLWCLWAYETLIPMYRYQADGSSGDDVGRAFKTMFAGAVATLVANFLFGILYGQDQADRGRNYEPKPVVVTA